MRESAEIHGVYHVECRDAARRLKFVEDFDNVVCAAGKNIILDAGLAGNGYVVNGPFMGLITATSYTGVNGADSMASHAGWQEAASYNAPRKLVLWSPASGGSKTTSTPIQFVANTADTIRGAFIVLGTGAVNTIGSTSGSLFSAGVLSADQSVVNGDSINITYTVSF